MVGDCKLRIANCKLQNDADRRAIPGRDRRSRAGGRPAVCLANLAPKSHTGQFAICNSQFAILNLCLALALLLAPTPAGAQTSYPMLTSVYPAGLQRGTTAELTVTGTNNFASAYDVLFEGKGLTAKMEPSKEAEAPAKSPAPGKKPPKAEVNTVTFK